MIKLMDIDRYNYLEVIRLSVTDEQKGYVANNMYSLAEAKAKPECIPLAIYNDDILIGFLMYGIDFNDKEYWIYRIMIDVKHQNKGYGKQTLICILDKIISDKEHNKVYISVEPRNLIAKELYEKLGFVLDGRIINEELILCLDYTEQSEYSQ